MTLSMASATLMVLSMSVNWIHQKTALERQFKLESDFTAKSCVSTAKLIFAENPLLQENGLFEAGDFFCEIEDIEILPDKYKFNVSADMGGQTSSFEIYLSKNTLKILSIKRN